MRPHTRLLTALTVLVLVAAACGDDDEAVTTAVSIAPPTTSAVPVTTTAPVAPATTQSPPVVITTAPTGPSITDRFSTLYTGTAGPAIFLAIDGEGRPVTLFPADRDGPHGKPFPDDHTSIVLTRCDDPACTSVTEVTIGTDPGWIDPMWLDITPDGRSIVGYATYPNGEGGEEPEPPGSGLIVCDDPACDTFTSTTTVAGDFRLAPDGRPVIMSTAEGEVDLEQCADIWCTDSTALEEISTGVPSNPIGFDIDADGYPIVARRIWSEEAYIDLTRCLDPMCSDTETFSLERPEGLSDRGMESVAFDSRGRPVIVYSAPMLGVVTCLTDDCADVVYHELVPSQGPEGSLHFALTADDRPVIAVAAADRELENYRIDVVVCDDPSCASATVATITDHGTIATAAALDPDGNPVVAFVYWSRGETHLYHCTDPRCEDGAIAFSTVEADAALPGREAVGPPAQGWRQLEVGAGEGFLMDAFRVGDGLAAYGMYPCPGGVAPQQEEWEPTECALLGTSADGYEWTWTRSGVSASFSAATAAEDTAVVGGQRCSGEGDDIYCIPLFWAVTDGTWTEAEAPCDGCAGWIDSLAAWSKGFIAFGVTNDGGGTWLSPDGLDWTRVDISGLFGEYERFSAFVEIDGTLHAYGNSCEVVDDWEICDGVLWTSTDGTTWSRDAALEGLDGFMPWTITETDFGYILEGALCPEPWVCPSSLMISTDGLSWVNVHPDDAPSEFTRVTGFGDGVLAIGELYDEFFGEEVRFVAQSPDLEEWSYFEVPPEMGRFGVNDLVAIDGGVVGIGVGDDNEITVWVWEP